MLVERNIEVTAMTDNLCKARLKSGKWKKTPKKTNGEKKRNVQTSADILGLRNERGDGRETGRDERKLGADE